MSSSLRGVLGNAGLWLGFATSFLALSGCLPQQQPAGPPTAALQPPEEETVAPELKQTKADLDAAIAKQTAGYTPKDKLPGKLEAFTPIQFTVERGKCYVGTFVLGANAAYSAHARQSLLVDTTLPGEGNTAHTDAFHGPGAVFMLGCPAAPGLAAVDVIANFGRNNDASRIHELGAGDYVLEIYAKPISEAELTALLKKQAEIAERQAIEQREVADQMRAEKERSDRERAERRAAGASQPPRGGNAAATGPGAVSVTLRNRCSRTVKVFYGKDPKFGSGTQSSLTGNGTESHSFTDGDTFWLLDDSGNRLTSVVANRNLREIEVLASCRGLTTR